MGEVDLIMNDGATRVMVEVRLRRKTSFGLGLETVAREKQAKLIKTAKMYQQANNFWGPVRFDVVSIEHQDDQEPEIEHIEHAFEVSE